MTLTSFPGALRMLINSLFVTSFLNKVVDSYQTTMESSVGEYTELVWLW